jgi:hypothetical protein
VVKSASSGRPLFSPFWFVFSATVGDDVVELAYSCAKKPSSELKYSTVVGDGGGDDIVELGDGAAEGMLPVLPVGEVAKPTTISTDGNESSWDTFHRENRV